MSNAFFYENHDNAVHVICTNELSFYPHLHRHAEFILQTEGCQQMSIDGKTRLLREGEAALVLPNRVHSYTAQGTGKHILGIVDISVTGEYASTLLSSRCSDPFLEASAVHPDAFHCALALTRPDIKDNRALTRAYIAIVLGRLLEALPLQSATQAPQHDTVRNLLMYISEHITEPISLELLSKNLFINKYSISRIFSDQIGCSLHTYINTLRVELAQNLLRDPSIPTAELIERCGFESERTFYRTFREHCGITPRQYRQNLTEKK